MVTRQPLPSNENNCGHSDLSFCSNVSEIKDDFSEQTHELNDDSELKIKMKRYSSEMISNKNGYLATDTIR